MVLNTVAPWAEIVPEQTGSMTADELFMLPEDGNCYELIEGRLVRMSPPGTEQADLSLGLGAALRVHCRAHHLGRVIGADGGFVVSQPDQKDLVLGPDVAFVRRERVPSRTSREWSRYWRLAPDLVAEVASPNQSRLAVAAKARLWMSVGVRLVWVVWPKARQVDVWRPGQSDPDRLGIDATLDGEDVVPGFSYPIAALFEE